MDNRLKLYDDHIHTYLEHEDKIKFREIAFKNKMTVSEMNRRIILLIINLYEMNKLNVKNNKVEQEFLKLINSLGGIFNYKTKKWKR